MTKKTRNWLLALSILVFPFVLFFGFLVFMEEPVPPVAPLPNPNGYDDLVKAGQMAAAESGNYYEMNATQLRELSGRNADALALARSGFSNECRVPVQFSTNYLNAHLNELAGLKRLAQGFVAEGHLAVMENRTNDAAQAFLDTIRLGNETAHGGVLIDELVGIAVKAMGTANLQTLVPRLDASTCREMAAVLEIIDSQGETLNESMQQENAWQKAFARLQKRTISNAEVRSSQNIDQSYKRKFDAQEQKERQLIIDLAARAYELDKGRPPASAADLVPDYLKAVPPDPATGTNMVYTPR
jgi:hypothetical protein